MLFKLILLGLVSFTTEPRLAQKSVSKMTHFVSIGTVEWWGAGVVICLEQGADLHMAQLMPLPLTVSCFSKSRLVFTFLVPAYPGSPGKRAVKRVCVCVCVCVWDRRTLVNHNQRLLCGRFSFIPQHSDRQLVHQRHDTCVC